VLAWTRAPGSTAEPAGGSTRAPGSTAGRAGWTGVVVRLGRAPGSTTGRAGGRWLAACGLGLILGLRPVGGRAGDCLDPGYWVSGWAGLMARLGLLGPRLDQASGWDTFVEKCYSATLRYEIWKARREKTWPRDRPRDRGKTGETGKRSRGAAPQARRAREDRGARRHEPGG
jgi:hypothetical protein